MRVSVLTATLPHRVDMLRDAIASVLRQTHNPVEHLIGVDASRRGAGDVLNRQLARATGDWVMVLDDDDLLDPMHIDIALAASDGVDVVYTMPRVEGGAFGNYEVPFNPQLLAAGFNCVSHTALMRTDLVRKVDGWRDVRAFDLDLFCRLEQIGAEFHQVPEVTWTYRLHGSNWSHGTLAEAAPL